MVSEWQITTMYNFIGGALVILAFMAVLSLADHYEKENKKTLSVFIVIPAAIVISFVAYVLIF